MKTILLLLVLTMYGTSASYAVVQRHWTPVAASTETTEGLIGNGSVPVPPTPPTLSAGDKYNPTNATTGLKMMSGVVYTSSDLNGKVYYNGVLTPNPYSNSAALLSAAGISTNGYNTGSSYNVAALLTNPTTANAFLANLPNLSPTTIQDIAANGNLDANGAVSLINAINSLISTNPAYTIPLNFTTAPLFVYAATPGDPLNSIATTTDFTKVNLSGISLAGLDLSGMHVTGAQLSQTLASAGTDPRGPLPPPPVASAATADYTGTSFAGLDLNGFSPNDIVTPFGPQPAYTNSGNFQNANFTGAKNLNVNVLARADNLSGAILTGTGITKAALTTAMQNLGISQTDIDNALATTRF